MCHLHLLFVSHRLSPQTSFCGICSAIMSHYSDTAISCHVPELHNTLQMYSTPLLTTMSKKKLEQYVLYSADHR